MNCGLSEWTKRLFFLLIVAIIPLGMALIMYNVLEPDNYWQRLISVVTVALILLVVGFRVIKLLNLKDINKKKLGL